MNAVSLSGGKDSTAMLLMMLEKGVQVDEVVVYDTGMEYQQMYEHLDRLERYTGMGFTRLHIHRTFEYWMLEHPKASEHRNTGYGWPRINARWCTSMKTSAIDRHAGKCARQFVGIAVDELGRCRGKSYPLVDWGITEKEALDYCKSHGFDWGGLYDHHKRLSCWCCPLQSLDDLRALRKHSPELWQRLGDMDKASFNDFKGGWSVARLEDRFAHEEMQLSFNLFK